MFECYDHRNDENPEIFNPDLIDWNRYSEEVGVSLAKSERLFSLLNKLRGETKGGFFVHEITSLFVRGEFEIQKDEINQIPEDFKVEKCAVCGRFFVLAV